MGSIHPTATGTVERLAAGTYNLIVDGNNRTTGAFKLHVSASNPTRDTCALAEAITGFDTAGNGTVTINVDTTDAGSSYADTCSSSDRDAVYYIDMPGRKDLSATVTSTDADWPAIYVRKNCYVPSAANDLACSSDSNTDPRTVTLLISQPGAITSSLIPPLHTMETPSPSR